MRRIASPHRAHEPNRSILLPQFVYRVNAFSVERVVSGFAGFEERVHARVREGLEDGGIDDLDAREFEPREVLLFAVCTRALGSRQATWNVRGIGSTEGPHSGRGTGAACRSP